MTLVLKGEHKNKKLSLLLLAVDKRLQKNQHYQNKIITKFSSITFGPAFNAIETMWKTAMTSHLPQQAGEDL